MLVSVFLKGLIAGFLIAAPVGPINVLCIRRTIVQGRIVGLVSGFGAAAADTLFGAVAAFGLSFVHDLLMREKVWFGVIGAAILVVIGIRTLWARAPKPKKEENGDPKNLIGDFTSTCILTLTNPVTVVSFLAVFSAFGVQQDEKSFADEWTVVGGVFLGAMLWWVLLTMGIGLFRGKFNQRGLRWTNRVGGILILAFAAVVLWNVATG